MFVDGRGIGEGETLEGDIVIVGAGAAGITLALALDGHGIRVLLIESGDVAPDTETQLLASGTNVGLPYFDLVSARLRYLGGSTNHWSGTCRPFDAFDFVQHDWIPDSGWPIDLADIERYYPRAEELCGLPSAEWSVAAWSEASPYAVLDFDAESIETRVAQNVRATRRRFARNYTDELERSTSITVALNTNLVEIELSDAGDAVAGMRLRTLAGVNFRAKGRRYVLAAGGLENPRLLLASNRQLSAGIGNGRDLVGRYFLEHPRFVGATVTPFDPHLDLRFYLTHDAGGSRITGYLALPQSLRERERLSDVQFRLEPRFPSFYQQAVESDQVAALRRLIGRAENESDLVDDLAAVADDLTSWRRFVALGGPLPVPMPEVVAAAITDAEGRAALASDVFGDIATILYGDTIGTIPAPEIDVVTRVEPVPSSSSRVRLTDQRDALGVPRIALDWQLSRQDRDSVVRAAELLGEELGKTGVGRLRLALDPDGDDWPDDLAGGWHHMGTTRMHDDPSRGVVDRDCRVHGMRDLYVAGSSVFTTAGSATPTLTIVALSLRLAEHLLEADR